MGIGWALPRTSFFPETSRQENTMTVWHRDVDLRGKTVRLNNGQVIAIPRRAERFDTSPFYIYYQWQRRDGGIAGCFQRTSRLAQEGERSVSALLGDSLVINVPHGGMAISVLDGDMPADNNAVDPQQSEPSDTDLRAAAEFAAEFLEGQFPKMTPQLVAQVLRLALGDKSDNESQKSEDT